MAGSKKQKGSRQPLLLKENPSNYFKKKTQKINFHVYRKEVYAGSKKKHEIQKTHYWNQEVKLNHEFYANRS
jgi:hypothetical protein